MATALGHTRACLARRAMIVAPVSVRTRWSTRGALLGRTRSLAISADEPLESSLALPDAQAEQPHAPQQQQPQTPPQHHQQAQEPQERGPIYLVGLALQWLWALAGQLFSWVGLLLAAAAAWLQGRAVAEKETASCPLHVLQQRLDALETGLAVVGNEVRALTTTAQQMATSMREALCDGRPLPLSLELVDRAGSAPVPGQAGSVDPHSNGGPGGGDPPHRPLPYRFTFQHDVTLTPTLPGQLLHAHHELRKANTLNDSLQHQLSEVGEREAQLRVSLASSVERERMAQERAAAAAAEAARARGESERRRDELQGTQGRLVDATSQLLEAEMELAQLRAQVEAIESKINEAPRVSADLSSSSPQSPPSARPQQPQPPPSSFEVGMGSVEQRALLDGLQAHASWMVGLLAPTMRQVIADRTFAAVSPSSASPSPSPFATAAIDEERGGLVASALAQQWLMERALRLAADSTHAQVARAAGKGVWDLLRQALGGGGTRGGLVEGAAADMAGTLTWLQCRELFRAGHQTQLHDGAWWPWERTSKALVKHLSDCQWRVTDALSRELDGMAKACGLRFRWDQQGAAPLWTQLAHVARRAILLELLCQALQPEVPGLSVVCGALQGRRWDAACMELDPLTCPLPTTPPLDQPVVLACVRPALMSLLPSSISTTSSISSSAATEPQLVPGVVLAKGSVVVLAGHGGAGSEKADDDVRLDDGGEEEEDVEEEREWYTRGDLGGVGGGRSGGASSAPASRGVGVAVASPAVESSRWVDGAGARRQHEQRAVASPPAQQARATASPAARSQPAPSQPAAGGDWKERWSSPAAAADQSSSHPPDLQLQPRPQPAARPASAAQGAAGGASPSGGASLRAAGGSPQLRAGPQRDSYYHQGRGFQAERKQGGRR